ncbi:hypothetical protein FISHEDRAFT_39820 [Fistulina hepatica ATCC 64428]|uniref:AN1-type domain-containing protein n=1 Tax=Fistulina hepatica ATCC 64428 TaxID=1128425 RepID=A0A0D7AJ71_9AGAR|nr:hypothetical protein FISHEDRAFT_39820 [Fistulina hepatica ATCC 64428]
MESSTSSLPQRDEQLLDIGKQCHHPSCLLVDFLPFKCQYCSEAFCQDHYLARDHACPKYDESKHNRIAPSCPLCNTPVAVKIGQDPNVRMEEHFARECSVMTGKEAKKFAPTCESAKCGKVLYAPIRCDKCRKQFCPRHRFAADHHCTKTSLPSNRTAGVGFTNVSAKASTMAASASAAATHLKNDVLGSKKISAFKSGNKPVAKAAQPSVPTSSPSKKPSIPAVFSTTERRARSERESRRRALQERAKKGLLSEQEKLILAAEEAEAASKKQGEDCVVM